MKFIIKAGHTDNSKVVVTGYLSAEHDEEKEILSTMVTEFSNIKTYNDKFSTDGKKVVFKSVELGMLKQTLQYLSETLSFSLKYSVAKDYLGEKELLKFFK